MKMQLTKTNAYIMGTFREIGDEIAKMLLCDDKNGKCFQWPTFSYAIATYKTSETLQNVASNSSGWYAMDYIEDKFDSNEIATILANYMGGGCAVALNLWLDEICDYRTTGDSIASVMKQSMEMQETVTDNTIIIADWKIEDFVLVSETTEVCPHCDYENNFMEHEIINGHAARCKKCGHVIFLCADCEYCGNGCNWHEIPGGSECAVGKIIETFIKK